MLTLEEQVNEIIREKLFHRTHYEIPHRTRQVIERWEELAGTLEIDQTFYVERKSQKDILVASAFGDLVRWAERDLSWYLKKPVALTLKVKVGYPHDEGEVGALSLS